MIGDSRMSVFSAWNLPLPFVVLVGVLLIISTTTQGDVDENLISAGKK